MLLTIFHKNAPVACLECDDHGTIPYDVMMVCGTVPTTCSAVLKLCIIQSGTSSLDDKVDDR